MAELIVHLTKVSDERHLFSYRRSDGSGETLALETRSFLVHDLMHFAVETEAGLSASFYGRLARAQTYDALNAQTPDALGGEAGVTEMVVARLTSVWKGLQAGGEAVAGLREWLAISGREPPDWLTTAFAEAVMEHMRRLWGQWRATPFGGTMTLRFGA